MDYTSIPSRVKSLFLITIIAAISACDAPPAGSGGTNPPADATLVSFSISPSATAVTVSETQQFQANGVFNDGNSYDITSQVEWSALPSNVLTISQSGLATGVASGSATITAFHLASGTSASTDVTVSTPPSPGATIQSITVTPSSSTIHPANTLQFTATAQYSDGSSQNVTDSVSWSTSPVSLGTITSAGVFTAGSTIQQGAVLASHANLGSPASALVSITNYLNEGSSSSYVDIGFDTDYSGSVATGSSYYRVPVTIGQHVYFQVTNNTGVANLSVYADEARTTLLCSSNNSSPSTAGEDETCMPTDPAASNYMYIVVNGSFNNTFFGMDGGATYTIRVQRGYVDEGDTANPVPVTVGTPLVGQSGTYGSYYSVAVNPGAEYTISLTSIDGLADLEVYPDGFWPLLCSSSNPNSDNEQCVAWMTDASTMLITIPGQYQGRGSSYTITVTETRAAYTAEGTDVAPVDLTASLPYTGMVDATDSYYAIPVTVGRPYTISLTGLEDDASLRVYDGNQFVTTTCVSLNSYTNDESCDLEPAQNSIIYVNVGGQSTTTGTAFVLNAIPITYTPEGSASTPLALGGYPVQANAGQVDTTASYYSVNVLSGADYLININNVFGDVDLYVYDNISMTTPVCTSTNSGVADESCLVSGASGNTLYIKVDGSPSSWGSTYTLDALRYYVSEGSSASPLDITGQTPYAGSVNKSSSSVDGSYYQITGLTGGNSYSITISGYSDSELRGRVLTDPASFSSYPNGCLFGPSYTYTCTFTLDPAASQIYVYLDGSLTVSGSVYTIDIQ